MGQPVSKHLDREVQKHMGYSNRHSRQHYGISHLKPIPLPAPFGRSEASEQDFVKSPKSWEIKRRFTALDPRVYAEIIFDEY